MLNIADELLLLIIAVIIQYILLQKRFSPKKTLIIIIIGVLAVFLVNVFFMSINYNLYKKLYLFTVNLPVFLIFIYLSKHRGFRILFNLLTTVFLCYLTSMCGYLLAFAFNGSVIWIILGRMLSFPFILLFLLKIFRPLYMLMLDNMEKGWALICAIPILSCSLLYIMFYYSKSFNDIPKIIIPVCITVAFTMIVYGVICAFFRQMQEKFTMENEKQLLKIQVEALQKQSNAVLEMEEKTRIIRHDTRHYIQNIAVLLQSGETENAINFISKVDDMLVQSEIPKYCENPTINAILTYYLENAKIEGIDIKTRLDIAKIIHIDEMELSTVLANAIENACHACAKMPEGLHKMIEIICVSAPNFVIEIANTYYGDIQFDSNGFPVSKEEAHGIGTKSIDAFVKKHHAILDYQTENSIFRLRILFPEHSADR
jgi:hypothetical protein